MFAPGENPPLAFHELWTTAIDPQGHYRIELSTLSIGLMTFPPTGKLLLPGSRSRISGKAGPGSSTSNPGRSRPTSSLTPRRGGQPRFTLLVDREGKAGARRPGLSADGRPRAVWSRQTADAQVGAMPHSIRARRSLDELSRARQISAHRVWHTRDAGRPDQLQGAALCGRSKAASWTRLANLWPASRSVEGCPTYSTCARPANPSGFFHSGA